MMLGLQNLADPSPAALIIEFYNKFLQIGLVPKLAEESEIHELTMYSFAKELVEGDRNWALQIFSFIVDHQEAEHDL